MKNYGTSNKYNSFTKYGESQFEKYEGDSNIIENLNKFYMKIQNEKESNGFRADRQMLNKVPQIALYFWIIKIFYQIF